MAITHHQKCLRRASVRREAGNLSNRLENIAVTDRALRNILGISTSRERAEQVMEKAKHGSEVTAKYILSRYYRYPTKLLKTMTESECRKFLNILGEMN
jgi:hypothetical protein